MFLAAETVHQPIIDKPRLKEGIIHQATVNHVHTVAQCTMNLLEVLAQIAGVPGLIADRVQVRIADLVQIHIAVAVHPAVIIVVVVTLVVAAVAVEAIQEAVPLHQGALVVVLHQAEEADPILLEEDAKRFT